jgi:hypothetical protein
VGGQVDKTEPTATLGGRLYDARRGSPDSEVLTSGSYPLTVTNISDPATNAAQRSGVRSVRLERRRSAEGGWTLVEERANSGCSGDNCAMADQTFDYHPEAHAEGRHWLRVRVIDRTGTASDFADANVMTSDEMEFVSDRSPPEVTLSGSLKDGTGATLAPASYELTVDAKDPSDFDGTDATYRSGVKSIEVKVDGTQRHFEEQPCPDGNCAMSETWTFSTDTIAPGPHTVTVVTTDHGGTADTQEFTSANEATLRYVHAKQYTDDPAAGGGLIVEEWADQTSYVARSEQPDSTTTRNVVSCLHHAAGCAEYRMRSRHYDEDSAIDLFVRYRGTSPSDDRIQSAGDVRDVVRHSADTAPDGSGPIGNVTEPWQTLPPGSGATYAYFDTVESADAGGTAVDDPNGGDEVDSPQSGDVTTRLVIESQTRLPIRETTYGPDNTLLLRRYWTYGSTLLRDTDLPPGFFTVERPASPEQEKRSSTSPPTGRARSPSMQAPARAISNSPSETLRRSMMPGSASSRDFTRRSSRRPRLGPAARRPPERRPSGYRARSKRTSCAVRMVGAGMREMRT